jgi:5-methyltetrahydrofolate--homocysteine methyltransferase
MSNSLQSVIKAIDELDFDNINNVVQICLDEGIAPLSIIQDGICKGLDIVGEKFNTGEYFLADLVMAGEIVNEVMPNLKARMNSSDAVQKGKVVMATVKGDIHEIGKNIVCMLLDANGFEVIDLGIDVSAERIVSTVKEKKAGFVGLSCLLSTMVGSIGEVVESLKREGLREKVRVFIGGACTSEQLKDEMGADVYSATAVDAVRTMEKMCGAMT